MITWINFLHLYQPPTQDTSVLDQITRESYARIPQLLRQFPKLKLTINFSGSLLELLQKNGYQPLLDEYKQLVAEKRIELVGSAMYHPILALLPEAEIERQINLQTDISRRIFGDLYNPTGFFIPEMAYSKKIAHVIKKLGFSWIILDEIHMPLGEPDPSIRYSIKENDLIVLFRNRVYSKTFPPEFIITNKDKIPQHIIITAHDGELYGHWHVNDYGYYEKAFTDPTIHLLTVSEYISSLTKSEVIEPREANWESLPDELNQAMPFALWDKRDNKIHELMWKFAYFTIDVINSSTDDKNYTAARTSADRGLASCAWWWATEAKLIATSPICWNPAEIEKGANELLKSLRSLNNLDISTRLEAERQFSEIRSTIWEKHWLTYRAS